MSWRSIQLITGCAILRLFTVHENLTIALGEINMFGFGGRAKARREAQEEFDTTCRKLRGAPESGQAALGHAINQAHGIFIAQFGSVDAFSKIPREEQFAYMERLSKAAVSFMQEKQDPASSMGFDLFKNVGRHGGRA
jgi:hypothetical protein